MGSHDARAPRRLRRLGAWLVGACALASVTLADPRLNLDGIDVHVPNGTHAERCAAKYPPEKIEALRRVVLGQAVPPRVLFAAMLHNSAKIVHKWIATLEQALELVGGASSAHVSILESGSDDQTASILEAWREQLRARGVGSTIRTRDDPPTVFLPFRSNDKRVFRLQYIATLRNEILEPLYASPGAFTHVVFVNDVVYCAPDVLRLLSHSALSGAQLACATDFWPVVVSTPTKLGSLQKHKELRTVFYDTWATQDMNGTYRLPERLAPLFWSNELDAECPPAPAPCPALHDAPEPVYSCWNGVAVFTARPFDAGVRFRWEVGLDSGSLGVEECATLPEGLVCKDMWRVGLGQIVLDPGVQVAYHDFVHALRLRHFASDGVPPSLRATLASAEQPESWECHNISRPGEATVDWVSKPPRKPLERNRGPLWYSRDWKAWPLVENAAAMRAAHDLARLPFRRVLLTGASSYLGRLLADSISTRFGRLLSLHCAFEPDTLEPERFIYELGAACDSMTAVDVSDARSVAQVLGPDSRVPDLVINADGVSEAFECEIDEARCLALNVPIALLNASHAVGAAFIGLSTDLVYAGHEAGGAGALGGGALAAGGARRRAGRAARRRRLQLRHTPPPPGGAASARAPLARRALYTELDTPRPRCALGRTKLALEAELDATFGARALVLRLSQLLGRRARGLYVPTHSYLQHVERAVRAGRPFEAARNEARSFTAVADVLRIVETLLQRGWTAPQGGVYNVGSALPARWTPASVARMLARQVLGPARCRGMVVGMGGRSRAAKSSLFDVSMASDRITLATGVELAAVADTVRALYPGTATNETDAADAEEGSGGGNAQRVAMRHRRHEHLLADIHKQAADEVQQQQQQQSQRQRRQRQLQRLQRLQRP